MPDMCSTRVSRYKSSRTITTDPAIFRATCLAFPFHYKPSQKCFELLEYGKRYRVCQAAELGPADGTGGANLGSATESGIRDQASSRDIEPMWAIPKADQMGAAVLL